MEYFFITLFLIIISPIVKNRTVTKIKHKKILKEIPKKILAEQTETRVCSECKRVKSIEEFKGANDPSFSYNGYFINCMLCRMQKYRKPRNYSSFTKDNVVTSKQSKSQITNDHKQKKNDKERI
jgi:hypothetical protein